MKQKKEWKPGSENTEMLQSPEWMQPRLLSPLYSLLGEERDNQNSTLVYGGTGGGKGEKWRGGGGMDLEQYRIL